MTILEASGHLYNWFRENDSFSLEQDFMKIITITEEPDRDKVAFKCALKNLEEMDMIKEDFSPDDHGQYWVLKKSFLTYEQSVAVSPDLAITISDIINKFCETTGNTVDICDPASINEKDLQNLIYIANVLVGEKKNVDSELEI
jgi:hypothetical protein